jgi:DNA-binding transcriptional LysR family regulator
VIARGFAAMGFAVERVQFAMGTDDLIAFWQLVRCGMGIGFLAEYMARTDPNLVAILPLIKLPYLPIWLTVHREIRTSQRIRAVYDFLAEAVPEAL